MVELTSLDNIKSRQGWWPRKKCLQQLKYCFTNEVFKYSCNGKCERGKPQKLSENFERKMFRLQSSISMGRAADVFYGRLRWFESFFISNNPPNVFSNLIFYLCWSLPSPVHCHLIFTSRVPHLERFLLRPLHLLFNSCNYHQWTIQWEYEKFLYRFSNSTLFLQVAQNHD